MDTEHQDRLLFYDVNAEETGPQREKVSIWIQYRDSSTAVGREWEQVRVVAHQSDERTEARK